MADSEFSITGISFVSAYVDDYNEALHFYQDILGLEKLFDMDSRSCYLKVDESTGLYIEGKNESDQPDKEGPHASFTFGVDSVTKLYESLENVGIEMIDDGPQDMGDGMYWFRFRDPAGNIVEALGDK